MEDIYYNYQLIRHLLNRKAGQITTLDFILSELATRVMSRLDYIKLQPEVIVDCGSGLGYDYQLLKQKFTTAKIYELDASLNILQLQQNKGSWLGNLFSKSNSRHLINANAYELPLKHQCVDLLYANQLLPYLSDLVKFFKEVRRVLRIGGSFCVAGLGVDSFKELRELGLSTYRFPDMHDVGDMLIEVGFSNPVVDTEYITLEYDSLATLLNDIKLIGCGAANSHLLRSPITRQQWHLIQDKLEKPIKLTLEIFVAHGWKDQQKIDLPDGYSPIAFNKFR